MKNWLQALRAKLVEHAHVFHASHMAGHCAYFTAVFIEGHGLYAAMAGVMLVLTILGTLIGED